MTKVLAKQTALNLCLATDRCWKRKLVSLGSNVTVVARSSSSCKKSKADLLNVPCDFMAIDTNAYLCDLSSYLTSFKLRVAASSAALPAVKAVVGK